MFKFIRRFIRRIIIFIILIIVLGTCLLLHKAKKIADNAIEEKSFQALEEEIKANCDIYTTYDEIPKMYVNAVLAVEDKTFFEHHGVNIFSIIRAVIVDLKTKSYTEGGSTITQQLVKNQYLTQEKTMLRKVSEIYIALQMEEELSKEEIFELYVNSIYYGSGYYNISDAAKGYFDKEVKDMTDFEATLLAGIPNAPSIYSPNANKELSRERHTQVLGKMVSSNYITEEEKEKILSEYDN